MREGKKSKRGIVLLLSLASLVAVGWYASHSAHNRLEGELDRARRAGLIVSDADYSKLAPDPSDNAFPLYEQALKEFKKLPPSDRSILRNAFSMIPEMSPHWAKNVHTFLKRKNPVTWKEVEAIAAQTAPFATVREAVEKPECFLDDVRSPSQTRLHELVISLTVAGEASARGGNASVAIDRFRTGFGIQNHIARVPTLLATLQACAYHQITRSAVMRSILSTRKEADLDLFQQFCREQVGVPSFRTALRTEPLTTLHDIDSYARKPNQAGFFGGELTWKDKDYWRYGSMRVSYVGDTVKAKLLSTLTDHYARLPHDTTDLHGTKKVLDDLNATVKGDASYAGGLVQQIQFDFARTVSAVGRVLVSQRMTLIVVTLQRERLRKGTFPDTLPKEAQDVLDPYSGKPFHYKRIGKEFRLYSVGEDGVDGGGVATSRNDVILEFVNGMPILRH